MRSRSSSACLLPCILLAIIGWFGSGCPSRLGPPQPPLPEPLVLPDSVALAIHVEHPGQVVDSLRPWLPQDLTPQDLAGRLLARGGLGTWGPSLAPHLDPERPWAAAFVGGELIVELPMQRSAEDAVNRLLVGGKPEGHFGGVLLPLSEALPKPVRAWFRAGEATLTVADSTRGLVTGPELAKRYGHQPLSFVVSNEAAAHFGETLLFSRVSGRGEDPFHITIEAENPKAAIPWLDELAPGGLDALLDAPEVGLAGTGRWAPYKDALASWTAQIDREVAAQNFLVRGVLEDLALRLKAVLRAWNGRILVGVGPPRHGIVAVGVDNPSGAERAVVRLMEGVRENLNLAQTFGVSVPKVVVTQHRAHKRPILYAIRIHRAARYLPAQVQTLLNARGDLTIAVMFVADPAAGLIVIGQDAVTALGAWVSGIGSQPSRRDVPEALLVARLAGALDRGLDASHPVFPTLEALLNWSPLPDAVTLRLFRTGNHLELQVNPTPVARVARPGIGGDGRATARHASPR